MSNFVLDLFDFVEKNEISISNFAKKVGIPQDRIYQWRKGRGKPKAEDVDILVKYMNENGINSNVKKPEALAIGVETQHVVKTKNQFAFTQLEDGRYKMDIKLVEPHAYAGYRAGYGDSEFIEDLPNHSIIVDELKRGFYRAFKVMGDSMYGNTPNAIWDGAIITGRNIDKVYWSSKLHINKWNEFIIVTTNDGILVKQIVGHDVEKGIITCHSYNENKSLYPDFDIDLRDVAQLFNVIKVENPR